MPEDDPNSINDSDELLARMEEAMAVFQRECVALDQQRYRDALQRERELESRPRVEYRTVSTQPSPFMAVPKLEDDPIPGPAGKTPNKDPKTRPNRFGYFYPPPWYYDEDLGYLVPHYEAENLPNIHFKGGSADYDLTHTGGFRFSKALRSNDDPDYQSFNLQWASQENEDPFWIASILNGGNPDIAYAHYPFDYHSFFVNIPSNPDYGDPQTVVSPIGFKDVYHVVIDGVPLTLTRKPWDTSDGGARYPQNYWESNTDQDSYYMLDYGVYQPYGFSLSFQPDASKLDRSGAFLYPKSGSQNSPAGTYGPYTVA